MSDFDSSKIERLKNRLYSNNLKNSVIDATRGTMLDDEQPKENVNQWSEAKLPEQAEVVYHPKAARFFKSLFIFSAIFCVIAAGVAVFIFWGNFNRISSNNIDVTIAGPVSLAGGEELPLIVSLNNNNDVDLVQTHVRVTYPEGTYVATDTTRKLPRDDRSLDTVKSHSQKQVSFESVIFGEENVSKDFTVTVEYQVPGSPTLYTKEKKYSILLTKAPISLLVGYEKSVNSGQNTSITVTAISNSQAKLSNIILKAMYPTGWVFTNASPSSASSSQDTWKLGSFDPGEQKKITIQGLISGQEGDQKVFRFSLGAPDQFNEYKLITAYVNTMATMEIQKPFVLTSLSLGRQNKDGDVVANPGDDFEAVLDVTNNMPRDLVDVVVQVSPHGDFFDRYSAKTENGFYKSAENILYWDKTLKSDLNVLAPNQKSEIRFYFKSLSPSQITRLSHNPQMALDVVVSGKSITEAEGTKNVSIAFTKKIKFSTQASVSDRTLFGLGLFKNTGPVPPQADIATTYTIAFDLKNTYSHISNVVVTATLPFYVEWMPRASTTPENITFDTKTRIVTWNVGELTAYTGYGTNPRTGSFQVRVTPSVSQIGTAPVIVSNVLMSGVDRFTGDVIQLRSSNLTTQVVEENLSGTVRQ